MIAAGGQMIRLPPPGDAARLAEFLSGRPSWSLFWDKRHGVWRAAEDDPDSALYAESPDLAEVIAYITAHSYRSGPPPAGARRPDGIPGRAVKGDRFLFPAGRRGPWKPEWAERNVVHALGGPSPLRPAEAAIWQQFLVAGFSAVMLAGLFVVCTGDDRAPRPDSVGRRAMPPAGPRAPGWAGPRRADRP